MATIVQRNQEISQAIMYYNTDAPLIAPLQPGEERIIYQRSHTGILYAVYLCTDSDIINFQIEQDGQKGINNCAYDLWNVQGKQTRDSGILFCKTYNKGYYQKQNLIQSIFQKPIWVPVNLFSVNYENGYGMRYNENFAITAANLSKDTPAKILQVMILYATVCD